MLLEFNDNHNRLLHDGCLPFTPEYNVVVFNFKYSQDQFYGFQWSWRLVSDWHCFNQ